MKYTPTIGIECHVQLKTKTKLFAAVSNDAREAPPNSLISHLCMGLPGALPVLNRSAVDHAILAAEALQTRVQNFSVFDRKHYFYPDLPSGYQISQLHHPIILGGKVEIFVDGKNLSIGVTRAHLEADAGKNTHPAGKGYSLVDLNRSGTPLLEIVSEPEMHSAAEAKAYARELYLLMKYGDVSECNLYYGNMRFDVNVSLSENSELGTRTETKNLNSFRSVEKAVEFEIKRQTELLSKGQEIAQETRGWDDAKQKTFSQRSKEDSHDYRYFPDPDIPPLDLTDEYIDEVLKKVGTSVPEIRRTLLNLGLTPEVVENILETTELSNFVVALVESNKYKSDLILNIALSLSQLAPKIALDNGIEVEKLTLSEDSLISLAHMQLTNKISSTAAKNIFEKVLLKGVDPEKYADEHDMLQVSDNSELDIIVQRVLESNPKAATDVKSGELKAIGFLVGQVMKESRGKANPEMVQQIIKDKLK